MLVEINPQSDRTRKQRVKGVILEILTKSENHPHGRLVKLKNGEQGRVKNILSDASDQSNTSVSELDLSKIIENGLKNIIEAGENHKVEFKADALWSSNYTQEDINNHRPQTKELRKHGKSTSKTILAKTIAGFLNSDGGTLVIGVREDKVKNTDEVIGVELEYSFLKDSSQDGYRRMLLDLIKDYLPRSIFNQFNRYFQIDFETIDGLTVCGITVQKSDKRVFLKLKGTDYFYIRTDASTREITGDEMVDYCENRFS